MRPILQLIVLLTFWIGVALPAQAAVTITFWSHEFGNSFPHAFFTLRGVADGGGPPVDANFGFTAKSLTPALLFKPVAGKLDIATPFYIKGSDAQFSVVMTDAQYAAVLGLVDAWSEGKPDSVCRVADHNCVTFVKEAARIVGLTDLDQPGLMKKPRSYLKAVLAGNTGRAMPVGMHGRDYLASLPPLVPSAAAAIAIAPEIVGATMTPHLPSPTSPAPVLPIATLSTPPTITAP